MAQRLATSEILRKMTGAKSARDLRMMMRTQGISLNDEAAQLMFERMHPSCALADDALFDVTGGTSRGTSNAVEKSNDLDPLL